MKYSLILFLGTLNILNTYPQYELTDANNNFAFKIYKSTKPEASNYFISPFSLHIALSIANEGARGTTRREIDKLLCLDELTDRHLKYNDFIRKTTNLKDSIYKNCIRWSDNKSGENSMYLANSLWINRDFEIDANYSKKIKDYYYSELFNFDEKNIINANQRLNKWVSEKTQNKINEIPGVTPDIMLSIINAIYFMGEWQVVFDKNKTRGKEFYTIDTEKISIDFMNQKKDCRYYEDNDVQAVYLPYKCHQFDMIVILPGARYGINKIEDKINSGYLDKIKESSYYHEVILSVPKFKIETELLLKEYLVKMGYIEMLSDLADFSGLSTEQRLKIGKIIHKTFIEINEQKTEAAAVTIINMPTAALIVDKPPPPKIFNADHPFMFLIVDNRTNAILFMGRFVKQ